MVRKLELVVRNRESNAHASAGIELGGRAPAALTDGALAAIRPGATLRKVAVGGSLYLWVAPAKAGGSKVWRLRYRLDAKQREYTIGPFGTDPGQFTLAQAREAAAEARALLDEGKDPVRVRQAARVHTEAEAAKQRAEAAAKLVTLAQLAEDWYADRSPKWSPAHRAAQRSRLDNVILPVLGTKPLGLVDAPLVLAFLKSIQQRGKHEVLAKCRIMLSQIFRYGIANGVATQDHTLDLRGAISRPDPQNRATIGLEEFPGLFEALAAVPAEEITKLALYWCIATACRTHEMRSAKWSEIGTAKVEGRKTPIPVWRVPATRMKMKVAWTQPLSPLALAILDRARAHRTSADPSALIFPGFSRSGTLSENALLALLARAGYYGRQTTHGFRGSFSTWGHEFSDKTMAVELCLAHRPGGVLGVYHKGEHLADRLAILTEWGRVLREKGLPC